MAVINPKFQNKNIIIAIQFGIILVLSMMLLRPFSKVKSTKDTMTEQKSSTSNSRGFSGPYANSNITYEIFMTMSRTWGYRILIEGNIMIVQNNKPGLPGNFGFRTKKQAKKVAELVTSKIRNGQLPPTVTIEELKSVGALE